MTRSPFRARSALRDSVDMTRHVRNSILQILVAGLLSFSIVTPMRGQAPVPQAGPGQKSATKLFSETDKNDADAHPPVIASPEQLEKIDRYIEGLGSRNFAERERVALELMDLGHIVLPRLRETAKNADDPEVRDRADQIIRQLTRGDMQARIDEFLSGKDVNFPGWRSIERGLGDSLAVRQLFVELLVEHPLVPTSLEGEPRDRALALEAAITKVQQRLFVERVMPSPADAFALLIPAVDENVPINPVFEDLILSLIDKETTTKIKKDAQLARPFQELLGLWIPRSSLSCREDVLLFGMRWELSRPTLGLAIKTVGEAPQVEPLVLALQAIAKFGNPAQTEVVAKLLDDPRLASDGGFTVDGQTEIRLGDVAIATIGRLHGLPLKDVGFPNAERDPYFEFDPRDLGFPVDDESPRKAARAKIDQIIEQRRARLTAPPLRPR